jgi:hypothetical protein
VPHEGLARTGRELMATGGSNRLVPLGTPTVNGNTVVVIGPQIAGVGKSQRQDAHAPAEYKQAPSGPGLR